MPTKIDEQKTDAYIPTAEEQNATQTVLKDYIRGKTIINKSYPQFNGRNLFDCVDDWTKRWNGYIPEGDPLLDKTQSRMFLNFTRNVIISYLVKTALTTPKPKILAVNKKTGVEDKIFAGVLDDLNTYSLNEENGDARYLESCLDAAIKGTTIKYEGYARTEQEIDVPIKFDPSTGKIEYKREKKVIFDNCFQETVPIEDFYIANPYQPDIQKQPFLIWRKLTTYQEASLEYGNYPNFSKVPRGRNFLAQGPTTFYRDTVQTELGEDQCEVIKYYNRFKKGTKHIVIVNGVVLYDGPFPFKDGKYPFAVGVFERFGNDFFWGMSLAQKLQGNQDLQNTFVNMMADKTFNSLLPFALSSDLDDFVEDETLELSKIRKVGDINKWKIQEWPGVNSGEMNMMKFVMGLGDDEAGNIRGGGSSMPTSGVPTARQVLLQQQEAEAKVGFSMSYIEDFERDRTALRIPHIIQFYSIPKIEKITGKTGQEVEKLMYREIKVSGVKLENGKEGQKIIKLVGKIKPDERERLADELSVTEAMGEIQGIPTEALVVAVDTFSDYNYSIQIIKNSSYQKNSVLDQSERMEFINWRLSLAQIAPLDGKKLVKWGEEAWDIDVDQFELPENQQPMPQQDPMAQQQIGQQAGQVQQQPPAQALAGSKLGQLSSNI